MKALRKIRNSICFVGVLFCWGIAGSIELERISLAEGVEYILAATVCVLFAFVFEAAVKIARLLLIRYAKKRAIQRRMLRCTNKVRAF